MSDSDDIDGTPNREIVNRMAIEDRDEATALRVTAVLVSELQYGKNFVNAQQFADLMRWFQTELESLDEVLERGRFEVFDRIEVIRVRPVTRMTVSEIVTKTGLPWTSVKRLITKSGLVPEIEDGKKYYNLNTLSPFLAPITKRREDL